MKKQEPNINKYKLRELIESNYALKLKSFKFIHKGADADSYLISGEDNRKFIIKIHDLVKIKKLHLKINFDGLAVLSIMHEKYGIDRISYPILTNKKKLSIDYQNYKLTLYNFIEGKNDDNFQLKKSELIDLAKSLAKVHKLPLHVRNLIGKGDEFEEEEDITRLTYVIDRLVSQNDLSNYQKKVLNILKPNLDKIKYFIEETRKSLKSIKVSDNDYVICHTDAYFLNLIKNKGKVWIIDWDGIELAPKEKDLWFYLVKTMCKDPRTFLESYGQVYGNFKLNNH